MDTKKIFLSDTCLEHEGKKINVREFYNDDGIFIKEELREEVFISKEVILALRMHKYLDFFYDINYKSKV